MENVWLTTDWHLYSKEWNDQHPHRSKANLERLATNFNSTIDEHDLLIHLGDICDPESADYETMKKIISSIPGRKILVRGNHDTEKDPYYIGLGFDDVVDVLVIHNMIFTHKPIQVAPDELNIHGHLHSEKLVSPTINGYRHINAFGANWNSIDLPILLEDLLDMASKQNIRLDPEEEKEIKSHFVKDLYGEDMRFSGKVLLDLTSEFVLAPMDEDTAVADDSSWYYYISADNSLDHKVIRPTKPENVFGTALFEKVVSADTVRVPLYKTIDGAVRSLHRLNLSSLKDKVFYVYVCNTNQLQLPFISCVPDAELTGEVWATEPVVALFYKAIQIDDRKGDGYNCRYGENPDNPTEYTKKIYDWSYHDVTTEQKPPIQLTLESASEDEMLSEILFTDTDSTKYWLADDRKFIEKANKGDAERKDTANVAIDEATRRIRNVKVYAANLNKWGTDAKHNVLYIAGLSGSGKSTFASMYADQNTDIIHLDAYFDYGSPMNKAFDAFLKSRNLKAPYYDYDRWEVEKTLEKFEKALEDFGTEQFSKNRKVIVEGVQLMDDTVRPDKNFFKTKCLVVLDTDAKTSCRRAAKRDGADIEKIASNYDNLAMERVSDIIRSSGAQKATFDMTKKQMSIDESVDGSATNNDEHVGYILVHGMKLDIYRKETENPNDPVDSTAHDLAFYYGVTKIANISISAVNTDEAFLYNFEVDEKYWNHGIGSEILKYVLEQYKVNELTVEETNYNAIRLYKRFGFKEYTTFTENNRPMLDMRIRVNLSEASRTREYERTDDNHAMTSPEEKREVFQKYGINAVGDTHEAEKEEEEARKKREAEKKLKATQKRMKKARDAKKRKAFFRKVKSKLPKIRGVKNEDADTSDAEYLDRDYAGYETNALWGDRTQFFVDQYRYKDAALDESAILKELQSTNGLTLLDHVQFNDALNEASFLGDNKQIPIQDAKEIASVAMKQLKDLIKKHQFRALKPKLYEIYGRDIIIEVLGGDQDLRIQHSKEFEVLANELNQSKVLDPYRNLIQEIDAGDGDEGCVYIQLKHKVTENIPANEAVSYIGVREALALAQETTHATDLSEGVLFNRNVPTTSQHLTYRPLKPNEKLYPVYVVVMHTGSVVSTVIKKATGDLYSHASISFDPSLTNMYSFGNKRIKGKAFANGFKKEDIHSEFFSSRNIPYAMYMVPVTKEELVAMKKRLDYFVKNENKFSFDMIGLVKIFFGIADNPENRYFCSRFVMDVLNAGRPADPYTQEESLVKPQDLAETNFARYVMGGYLKDYNPKTCAYLTKKLLAEEEVKRRKIKGVIGETVDTAVYDINYNNPWIDHVLWYQFTRMDESIVDPFIRYLQSFKVRIDANGDILVTRREYDQLNAHFKNSLKLIKAYENAGNLVGVKDELCKIYYMVELINTYYLRQDVKNLRDKAADVRKDMVDLRSIMLNAFAQHMRYVTTREPDWNFKTYYDASKYGNDFRIPKKFLLSLGKTIITALS